MESIQSDVLPNPCIRSSVVVSEYAESSWLTSLVVTGQAEDSEMASLAMIVDQGVAAMAKMTGLGYTVLYINIQKLDLPRNKAALDHAVLLR